MQSALVTALFVCCIFLLLISLASPHEPRRVGGKSEKLTGIPKVTIEQITAPVDHCKSPHWDERLGKLYYSDAYNQIIYRLDPATGELTYTYIANYGFVGVVVPVEGQPNKFIAGVGTNFVLITWDSDKNCTDPIVEDLGTVDNGTHLNNGKVDSHGRFWAGTIGPNDNSTLSGIATNQASLYRFTSDRVIKKEISPVTISNGIAWNKENTKFYYVDSATRRIAAYDFDARHGEISNKRIVFDLAKHNISGFPDGVVIDTNDNLWITSFIGVGQVINVDPVQGELLQAIVIPADKITSIVWGGNSFDTLYLTTSRHGSTPEQVAAQPGSGSIFAVKGLDVRGCAGNSFILDRKR